MLLLPLPLNPLLTLAWLLRAFFLLGEKTRIVSVLMLLVFFMACGVGDIENENLKIIFLATVVISMVL